MRLSIAAVKLPQAEPACAALCLALVVPFTLFVLLEGSVSPHEYFKLSAAFLGVTAFMAIGAIVLYALLELSRAGRASAWSQRPAEALAQAFSARWKADRFFSLCWPLALFMLLLPSFNAFKQRILPQAGFRYDADLAAIDRVLFGADPGPWLHQLLGSPATTRFFDAAYHGWFVPTTLGLCVVGLCASTRTRGQYMLAYAAIWIILGSVIAWIVPAAGPAFYQVLVEPAGAEPFLFVHEQLALAGDTRFLTSLGNQAYLRENFASPSLAVGGGISAIPSIHNAMAALFALASFRVHRLLGLFMLGFAMLIWIASVYLNWHYAIDGIVGAAGATAIWFGAGWIVDQTLARSGGGRAPAPMVEPVPA